MRAKELGGAVGGCLSSEDFRRRGLHFVITHKIPVDSGVDKKGIFVYGT